MLKFRCSRTSREDQYQPRCIISALIVLDIQKFYQTIGDSSVPLHQYQCINVCEKRELYQLHSAFLFQYVKNWKHLTGQLVIALYERLYQKQLSAWWQFIKFALPQLKVGYDCSL